MKKESVLNSTHNLYKTIINASYDCFCVTDSTGHYIVANQATLDSMQLKEEEVLGKTPYDLMFDNVYNHSTILEAIKTKNRLLIWSMSEESSAFPPAFPILTRTETWNM